MSMSACPGCGKVVSAGPSSGSWFKVFRCTKCSTKYCFQCRGSNEGTRCPDCGSTSYEKYGEVHR